MRIISFLILFSFSLLMTGCGNYVSVSGTVTFPDGTPLTVGTVVFQSGTHVAKGTLDSSGRYRLGSKSQSDGLPPGEYKVYVSGAGAVPEGFVPPPSSGDPRYYSGSDESGYVSWVDPVFVSPETTPLSCAIVRGQTFDFQVEPFTTKK